MKFGSIQHRSKLIFCSKISVLFHFWPSFTNFGAVSIILRCGNTQRNHIDNIITNNCKLISNIPGSGSNLEFNLVSQDSYLELFYTVKSTGMIRLWYSSDRPILYKEEWRFVTTGYVISLTVPSLSQFINFTSLSLLVRVSNDNRHTLCFNSN